MTNELEKTFFDTFGIEPKNISTGECKYKITPEFCESNCLDCKNTIKEITYPQITDRILLELICISKQITMLSDFFMYRPSIEELKNNILENMLNKDLFNFKNKDIKHQVRTLFGE